MLSGGFEGVDKFSLSSVVQKNVLTEKSKFSLFVFQTLKGITEHSMLTGVHRSSDAAFDVSNSDHLLLLPVHTHKRKYLC